MTEEEFVLIIVAMVLCSAVLIVGIKQISTLIRSWLNRNRDVEFSNEEFHRLTKAFVKHKNEIESRLQHIEEIVVNEGKMSSFPQIEEDKDEGVLNNDLERKERN